MFKIQSECTYVTGVRVVDETQVLVVTSSKSVNKYELAMYTVEQETLVKTWAMGNDGHYSRLSPLYGRQIVLVGSNKSARFCSVYLFV
jgi:hypothetical protein